MIHCHRRKQPRIGPGKDVTNTRVLLDGRTKLGFSTLAAEFDHSLELVYDQANGFRCRLRHGELFQTVECLHKVLNSLGSLIVCSNAKSDIPLALVYVEFCLWPEL
jgi:hypothetical protein